MVKPTQDFQQAFISIWQDHNNYAKLAVVHSHGGLKFEINTEVQQKNTSDLHAATQAQAYWLRINKRGPDYDFSVSTDGKKWDELGSRKLNFIDLRIGFGACSPESKQSIPASFDFMRIATP